jgi:hypothetical protein
VCVCVAFSSTPPDLFLLPIGSSRKVMPSERVVYHIYACTSQDAGYVRGRGRGGNPISNSGIPHEEPRCFKT